MTQSEEVQLRTMEDGSSTSPVLLSPVASDVEDGGWVDPARLRNSDEPSSWQPVRRIVVFMGCVSLACTFIVIAIVVVAVILSADAVPKSAGKRSDTLHLIPTPTKLPNLRSPTIVVKRDSPNIWRSYVADLSTLLREYRERQKCCPSLECDLAYSMSATYCFPLELISDNCSDRNNFGYDAGSPCVALVLHVQSGFVPKSFNVSNPAEIPELIRSEYDPSLVYLTCTPRQLDIRYTPHHGFPLHSFSENPTTFSPTHVPPLVMIQFINLPPRTNISVTCVLWAKNIDHTGQRQKFGRVTFRLLVV